MKIVFSRISIRLFFPMIIGCGLSFLFVSRAQALGLSPPEEQIGYLPVGSSQTVAATISRAPEEMSGNLTVTVSARKSAADFFHGESSFVIPDGTREITYLYNIIPTYPSTVDQELYVTFLLQSTTITIGGVGVISGVTQVVRFTTDVVAIPGSSGTSSGGSSSDESQDDEEPSDETPDEPSDSSDESLSDTTETDTGSQADTQIPEDDSLTAEEPSTEVSVPVQVLSPETQESLSEPATTETDSDISTDQILSTTDIDIQSQTHPLQDTYYRGDGVMLSWLVPGQNEETSYRFVLNQNPVAQASELIFETQNPSVFFGSLPDGIYYFHLLSASDPDGEMTTHKIMVDNTPPVVDSSVVSQLAFPVFAPRRFVALEVIDILSGVTSSQASINGTPVNVTDIGISLRGLGFGQHQLVVQAIDKAGNERTAEFVISIRPRYPVAEMIHRFLRIPGIIFSMFF